MQSLAKESMLLLKRVITKGGLIGQCAKLYLSDKEKRIQYILECAEHCHNKFSIEYWDEDLVKDILSFSKSIKNK